MSRGLKIAAGALVALVLVGGLWLLVRDSSIVRVKQVEIVGVDGARASRLRAAALDQTTLNVDESRLQATLGDRPPVKSFKVNTEFPNRIRIEVVLFRPVAVVAPNESGGVAVASDGTVLQGTSIADLPRISGTTAQGRVQEPKAMQAVSIVAAAPESLLPRIAGVRWDAERGAVITMRRGPELYFGDADQLKAKWAAVVTVLADPATAGARYVDVRVPRRPAVGGGQGGVQGGIDPADPT
ncbi:MAG: cell division protein FtsQ/DivIB, partial [Actinomycetes bacterium]